MSFPPFSFPSCPHSAANFRPTQTRCGLPGTRQVGWPNVEACAREQDSPEARRAGRGPGRGDQPARAGASALKHYGNRCKLKYSYY